MPAIEIDDSSNESDKCTLERGERAPYTLEPFPRIIPIFGQEPNRILRTYEIMGNNRWRNDIMRAWLTKIGNIDDPGQIYTTPILDLNYHHRFFDFHYMEERGNV